MDLSISVLKSYNIFLVSIEVTTPLDVLLILFNVSLDPFLGREVPLGYL
jgi:hypothetical protein